MLKILVYLIFMTSAGLAAFGIILSSRLRTRYRQDFFSHLLYFEVFIYTFGFYGIWGRVVLSAFLYDSISSEMLVKVTDISLLLGIPFLVFAWLMLILFCLGVSGRKAGKGFIPLFLFINFSILLGLGYYIREAGPAGSQSLFRYYFIVLNLAYSLTSAYIIHFPWKGMPVINDNDRRIIAPVLFLIMIVQNLSISFYSSQPWPGLIFIIAFFAGNTFLPLYFNYFTIIQSHEAGYSGKPAFDEFCRKFEISPRESEIIREICNGLSNKEISATLFISLQTVKDHTHRIYIKTNVRSRVQLINLVKENLQ